MAKGKSFPLSIVVRSVDKATAGIRRINDRIARTVAPVRRLGATFRRMSKSAGLPKLARGFRRVGREIRSLALGVGAVVAAAGLSARALKGMIDQGDRLAKTADRIGVTVDGLAQLRHAAELSGVASEQLDSSLGAFSKRLGEARAGSGALTTYLKKANPALLEQLIAADGAEEALGLMADAMAELKRPTDRAALASAAFSRAGMPLINLLVQGRDGVDALKREYAELAGPQEASARASEKVNDALTRVSASVAGVKASIISGLAPAFLDLAGSAKEFFAENREAIAAWVKDFGEKLPARIDSLIKGLKSMGKVIAPVWNAIGGLAGAAKIFAAVLAGKLVVALVSLGYAITATPLGLLITGIAALILAGKALYDNWGRIKSFFVDLWNRVQERFGGFISFVKTLFLNFTPLGLIIKHWGPITGFFESLWDGVAGVFRWVWDEVIKPIVDKIMWAADRVRDVKDYLTGGSGRTSTFDGLVADAVGKGATREEAEFQARKLLRMDGAAAPQPRDAKAHMTIDITGMRPGMRADIDSAEDMEIDLSTGYQMGPA